MCDAWCPDAVLAYNTIKRYHLIYFICVFVVKSKYLFQTLYDVAFEAAFPACAILQLSDNELRQNNEVYLMLSSGEAH